MRDIEINFATKDRTPPSPTVVSEAVSLLSDFIKNSLKKLLEITRDHPVIAVVMKQELDGTPFMISAHLDYKEQYINNVLVREVDPVVLKIDVPLAFNLN